MLTLDEGTAAVRMAREAVASYIEKKMRIKADGLPPVFNEKRGVFVSIHEQGELRGCIGYPFPVLPLGQAIVDSAINACSRDPRFPCLQPAELKMVELEVTVLTTPEPYRVPKKMLLESVRIGRDGLIVSRGGYTGLLLPQVAPECGFDAIEFLGNTCLKAGLPADAWLDEDTVVLHFEAQIFSEAAPGGEVIEKSYSGTTCGA
jgi:uncharacterized protein (TIGR00296 family)